MAYDPLTRTTRRVRTSLLAFSTGLLFTTIFRVEVNTIPFSGIEVGVEQGLIKTVLLSTTLFSLLYFLIYFVDDVIYLKNPDVLANDNTDIRNQLTNLDQYLNEASLSQELKEDVSHLREGGMDKYNDTLLRMREIRKEVYRRIMTPRRQLHLFSKFRIFVAEGVVPVGVAVFASYAAIMPLLPEAARAQVVIEALRWVREVSTAIGAGV